MEEAMMIEEASRLVGQDPALFAKDAVIMWAEAILAGEGKASWHDHAHPTAPIHHWNRTYPTKKNSVELKKGRGGS